MKRGVQSLAVDGGNDVLIPGAAATERTSATGGSVHADSHRDLGGDSASKDEDAHGFDIDCVG